MGNATGIEPYQLSLNGSNPLTLKGKSFSLKIGSGQVLVGLLDFKSSGGQKMSVVGSIPMHFRQLCFDMSARWQARASASSNFVEEKRNVWNRNARAARHPGHHLDHFRCRKTPPDR